MGASYFQVLFDYKGKTYVGKMDLSEGRTGNLRSVTCFPVDEPHKSRPLFFNKRNVSLRLSTYSLQSKG
jgi:hypothetical protein